MVNLETLGSLLETVAPRSNLRTPLLLLILSCRALKRFWRSGEILGDKANKREHSLHNFSFSGITVASVLDCMYRAKAFACGNSHSSGSFSTPLALQMFVYPDMFQEEH